MNPQESDQRSAETRAEIPFPLSVVIPVFNEASTIEALIEQVLQVPIRKQIVVVDDASEDDTAARLDAIIDSHTDQHDSQFVRIRLDKNRGKGAAVRKGFAAATGEILLIQDADLEYDPQEYEKLMAPILNGETDVVYGSRFLESSQTRNLTWKQKVGNRFLTWLSNRLNGQNLTDMETCFKAFRRSAIEQILPQLRQNRFGIEPELTTQLAKKGIGIKEVAIGYQRRTVAEGKKIRIWDGFAAIWHLIQNRWFR